MTTRQELPALQAALTGEHIAIFGYGVLGAHLAGPQRDEATRAWTAHRSRRDRLRSYIRAAGGTPVASAAAYRLPFPMSSPHSAEQLAARLEDGVATAYIALTGVADAEMRRWAALVMQEATVRAVRWRGSAPPAFPGLPDSALTPPPE